jgi:hypothetical protein
LAAPAQAGLPQPATPPRPANPELSRLLDLYVERFNRQDWDGIRELVSADARLRVADRFSGAFARAPYFSNYQRWPARWRLAVGNVDGVAAVIIHFWDGNGWAPTSLDSDGSECGGSGRRILRRLSAVIADRGEEASHEEFHNILYGRSDPERDLRCHQ